MFHPQLPSHLALLLLLALLGFHSTTTPVTAAAVNGTLADTVNTAARNAPASDSVLTVKGAAPVLDESARADRAAQRDPAAAAAARAASAVAPKGDDSDENSSNNSGGGGASAGSALSSALDGFEEAGLHLPLGMKQMLSSALSGMDRAAGGLLSELSATNRVEFAHTPDGKTLIARLHVPGSSHAGADGDASAGANRKVHVAVVGWSHMRVRTEMLDGNTRTASTHTIRLPKPVSSKGIEIAPAQDGSVHVRMRILQPGEAGAGRGGDGDAEGDGDGGGGGDGGAPEDVMQQMLNSVFRPIGMPMFNVLLPHRIIDGDGDGDGEALAGDEAREQQQGQRETVAELPSAANIQQCRRDYGGDALRRRKCLCDVTPLDERRAVCYAELISRCVRVARRLDMNDFATTAKHLAVECADARGDSKTQCLADVTRQVLEKLNSNSSRGGGRSRGSGAAEGSLEGRIRTALESEDDGPSDFQPSTGDVVVRLVVALAVIALAFAGALVWVLRSGVIGGRAQSVMSQLSSVLAQSTSSTPASSPVGTRRTTGQHSIVSPGRNKSSDKVS